jgi:hypothetical protein
VAQTDKEKWLPFQKSRMALEWGSQGSYLFCHFWYFSLTGLQNYRINSQLRTDCKKLVFFFTAAWNNYF